MADPVRPPATQKGQALKQIAGYELIEKVGQGGMGAVFKARQISLDRTVALKVLPPNIAKNQEFIERFMREARAAGRLNHPHIVQGIDVGLCEKTGLYYFAMEFVDGPPLGRALKDSGAFPEEFVRKVAHQIGEALDYANQSGIVHRDIKPDNILMNSQGLCKLADLGLAKQVTKQEDASLTQAGIAVGTPFYMAPEQVRGQLDQIDIRTDLYCLGATLFHLATGRPPYQGATNAVVMAAHLTDKVPYAHQLNPQVSEGFSRLLFALMQKDRTKRPIDPKVFLEMLERSDEGESTTRRGARGVRGPAGSRDNLRTTTGPRDRIRPTTGPRDRVNPSAGGTEQTAARSGTTAYFLIGLAAVALLGGVILAVALNRKKEEPPKVVAREDPPKPIPVPVKAPPPPPKPEWDAPGAFEKVQRAVAQNPNDLHAAYLLYQQLLDEAGSQNAPENWMGKLKTARDEAKAKYEQQVGQARSEMEQKVHAARQQHKYDDALQVLADFPSPDDEGERERLKALDDELRKEAEGLLLPLLQDAEKALTEGRLDDADAHLKKADGIDYLPMNEAIGTLQNRLLTARQEAEQKAAETARVAADEGWLKLLKEFDAALIEKGDLDLLRVILKTAREDGKLEPRKDDLALLTDVGGKLQGYVDREQKALAALAGKDVTWTLDGKQVNGRIKSVTGTTVDLMVKLDKVEMVRKVKIDDLTEDDRALFRPALSPQTEPESLAAALTQLRKGVENRETARRYLAGAGDSTLAVHYRDMLREQAGDEKEAVAEKAWKEIVDRAAGANLTPAQMERVRNDVEAFKQGHGATQFAADHQKDILALIDKVTPKETGSVTADRLILWNFRSLYGESYERATTKANVILYLKDKPVWQALNVRVISKLSANATTDLPLPNVAFDHLRIFTLAYIGQGAGFTEIQVFKGEKNIALGRRVTVSGATAEGPGSAAVDGVTSGERNRGWCVPDRLPAWLDIDFSTPAATEEPAPAKGADHGAAGNGNWQTPLGGKFDQGEDGRASIRGPGTGEAEAAIAVYNQTPAANMEVQGKFNRHGPYAGFVVGYDEQTQRFISIYSHEGEGLDLYLHQGKERKLWNQVPEIRVPEEWISFRIRKQGRNMLIELNGKSHEFKLPEDFPENGGKIGLITYHSSRATVKGVSLVSLPDLNPPKP